MIESFDTFYGAFLSPDRSLARSLPSLHVMGSKLLLQHLESGCGDLKRRAAPSFLTCSAHTDHPPRRQEPIQYP
jgi:hypothetical protein